LRKEIVVSSGASFGRAAQQVVLGSGLFDGKVIEAFSELFKEVIHSDPMLS
jgi:hypothetical protein